MLLPFSKLASRFPGKKSDGRLHPETLLRWHINGLKNTYTGQRIKLRAVKVGGRWCSCRRWLREFFAAVEGTAPTPPETTRQRDRHQERVMEELRRRGFGRVKLGGPPPPQIPGHPPPKRAKRPDQPMPTNGPPPAAPESTKQ